eukprot:CAMPEP_0172585608 /NCGR_PEP_ID=MMETSP1068-20121228/5024_1 /TAXON_ID=35684 /ORGANISM="Pseudopedinella elastica, Strain CCMP716" /LENGTH=96 /DNA_ID=CAMNT_0013380139 /DNA_START=204 /DNA_END=494 /DNA_ORIENTATION=+
MPRFASCGDAKVTGVGALAAEAAAAADARVVDPSATARAAGECKSSVFFRDPAILAALRAAIRRAKASRADATLQRERGPDLRADGTGGFSLGRFP